MPTIRVESLTANAYRILGLPATASAEAVNQAARKMRLWNDEAHIPPTPWDVPALGPVSRKRAEVDQAESRLQEPQSRVWERLLWFHAQGNGGALPRPPSLDGAREAGADSSDPAGRHDAALAALHAALVRDSSVVDPSRWRLAMGAFARLCESEDYRQWMRRIESEGDFEKRAETYEVDDAIGALPHAIAEVLAAGIASALDVDDAGRCGRIFALLVEFNAAELQERARGQVESVLDRNCRLLHEALDKSVRYDLKRFKANKLANARITVGQTRGFRHSILPLAALLGVGKRADLDDDRQIRVRQMVTGALAKLGLAWGWAGEPFITRKFYRVAMRVGQGTSQVPSIRKSDDEVFRRMGGEYAVLLTRRVTALIVIQFLAASFIVCLPIMAWESFKMEMISRHEHSPTVLDMTDFPGRWHDQRWVSLTGELDVSRIVQVEIETKSGAVFGIGGRTTTTVQIWVPFVAPGTGGKAPVQIFARYPATQPGNVHSTINGLPQGTTTITGMLDDFSPYGEAFYGIAITPPYLALRPGETPEPAGAGLTLLLICVIAWLILIRLELKFLARLWRRTVARAAARSAGRKMLARH